MLKRKLKNIGLLMSVDLRRLLFSSKAVLLLIFAVFFTTDFAEDVMAYVEGLDLAVTPYVYPVFAGEWRNSFYILMLICVLMSDAPFRNGSELYIRLRTDKYTWFFAKMLYIVVASAVFQALFALLCFLAFLPDIGFSAGWGYVLRTFCTSRGLETLLAYVPWQATAFEYLITTGVSILLGILMFLINGVSGNYTGTIAVSIISCAHMLLKEYTAYITFPIDLDLLPTGWVLLAELGDALTAGQAVGILALLILILIAVGALLLKENRIEICR